VQQGLRPVWSMPPEQAVPFVYKCLIDFLCSTPFIDPVKVLVLVNQHLREPFVINDDSWGTGANAEAAISTWERRFPMATRRGT
jgi:hypothetical protein